MFLIDDLLLFPARGLLFVFREIHHAAQQAQGNAADQLRNDLTELYMQLETKQITEDEFTAREAELLDRLDALAGPAEDAGEDGPAADH